MRDAMITSGFAKTEKRALAFDLLNRGWLAVANLYRAWRNRRDFYRLGAMSDSELKDIGLTRSDLYVASTSPFGADPTTRLREIVQARFDECPRQALPARSPAGCLPVARSSADRALPQSAATVCSGPYPC